MKTIWNLPIALGMFAAACSGGAGDATERTTDQLMENRSEMNEAKKETTDSYREERQEAARELRELREDLVTKKERQEKRLADGIKNAEKRAECEARIAELNRNIARVDASLVKVDDTNADWAQAKQEAREAVDDSKNWIQREAEKVDWETGADADNDGH